MGVPGSGAIRQNVLRILEQARSAHPPPLIIHVRNTGDRGEPDEKDSDGWELITPPLLPSEIVIDKRKNNAFAETQLGEKIPKDAEIVIVGFQTDFAVKATALAATARGNEVLLIRGAHGTGNGIEVLHGGGIKPASRIVQEVETELEDAGVHVMEFNSLSGLFTGR